ncbi:DUF805 domain-containing protein [Hymenobacter sp. NST-14]|uniref:DUF805 domain-containing protein n=1 Tax=Hymenobacter piscis TaxID=2839984 RepID=UPI001C035C13|nr:DUF805 domain-containing protein [Hymenobacter piscis]MBT9395451.1 DUF805 domain-containing protein [Hymenobacter piscis]
MKEFFLFRGRLRRRAFWGRVLGVYSLAFGWYAVVCQLAVRQALPEAGAVLLISAAIVLATVIVVIQSIKRLHDLNLSGWWGLLLLMPWIGYGLGIGMQLVEGSSGPNRFGPDPKGRTAYVQRSSAQKSSSAE